MEPKDRLAINLALTLAADMQAICHDFFLVSGLCYVLLEVLTADVELHSRCA